MRRRSVSQRQTTADGGDEVFTFVNAAPGVEYPQRIIYRRATEGWLYATVEGKIKGVDKQVIFPMRRVDCQTGADRRQLNSRRPAVAR